MGRAETGLMFWGVKCWIHLSFQSLLHGWPILQHTQPLLCQNPSSSPCSLKAKSWDFSISCVPNSPKAFTRSLASLRIWNIFITSGNKNKGRILGRSQVLVPHGEQETDWRGFGFIRMWSPSHAISLCTFYDAKPLAAKACYINVSFKFYISLYIWSY